jgi:anhydro-N-acetylmuramic acid kinase
MIVKNKYRILGLMSGTSLDGLDLAFVEFSFSQRWKFKLLASQTIGYDKRWKKTLAEAHNLSSVGLLSLHAEYGHYIGKQCLRFIRKNRIRNIDAISSHGHTIFHQPEKGFTFQLGDGQAIHSTTNIPVIYDFRSLDVMLGGEGAPLVPIGDRLLFSSYDACLNLGGIANISMEVDGKRRAFDLCYCNMALNHLMKEAGSPFDRNGKVASTGIVHHELLKNILDAYSSIRKKRRSLGREFFEIAIQPLLDNQHIPLASRLRTVCESVAVEVRDGLPPKGDLKLLATGGGSLNKFLLQKLHDKLGSRVEVVLPDKEIINFKEALIFAFLGVLRLRQEVNVLSSVTRASRDSCSGAYIG